MSASRTRTVPRWLFLFLAVGGAWASGIYLGKMTVEGPSAAGFVPLIGFAVMGLLMAWGALSAG